MILAMLMFIRSRSRTTSVVAVAEEEAEEGRLHVPQDKDLPDYVSVFRVSGPLLFGATDSLLEIVDRERLAPIVILKLRCVTAMDATGLRAPKIWRTRSSAWAAHSSSAARAAAAGQSDGGWRIPRACWQRQHLRKNTAAALVRARELHAQQRTAA